VIRPDAVERTFPGETFTMYRIPGSTSNNFDFIRLFLAILVIFSHSYILATGSYAGEPTTLITHNSATGGGLAVAMFFLISGYLVTGSFDHARSVWSYFKKRIMRIYPGFIGVSLFTLLLVFPLASAPLKGATVWSRVGYVIWNTLSLGELKSSGAFLTNAYPNIINGSIWTIRYEFICYIFLAGLGLCGVIRSRRACVIIFALTWAVWIGFSAYAWNWDRANIDGHFGSLVRFLTLFLAGAVTYLFRDKLEFRYSWAAISLAALAAASYIPCGFDLAFPLIGSYLTFFLAYNPSIRLGHFARYGDFSYGSYLYAFPIQQLIVLRAGGHMDPMALFFMATPLTLIAGILSWHLIEKRFLSRSRMQH
jgi:peptidoglycan/LPS O-acetylase OafA/YrhL